LSHQDQQGNTVRPLETAIFSCLLAVCFVASWAGGSFRASHLILLGVFVVLGGLGCGLCFSKPFPFPRPVTLAVFVVYLVMLGRDMLSWQADRQWQAGLLTVVQSSIPMLLIMFWPLRACWSPARCLSGIVWGFAIYACANYISYILGYRGTLRDVGEFYITGISGNSVRWPMVFAPGINAFGVTCGVFAAIAVGQVMRASARHDLQALCGAGSRLLICVFGTYVVETRAVFYLLILPMLWNLGGWLKIEFRVALAACCLLVAAFGAVAYTHIMTGELSNRLERVAGHIGRDPGHFWTLSNRIYLWEYALENIKTNGVPVYGQGIAGRDLSYGIVLATGDTGLEGITKHAHNGGLECYVTYGPLGAIVLGAVVSLVLLTAAALSGASCAGGGEVIALAVSAVVLANVTESFFEQNTFWLFLVLGGYMIDWTWTRRPADPLKGENAV